MVTSMTTLTQAIPSAVKLETAAGTTVKVHPHRSLVTRGIEACVSITPTCKGGRAYYRGSVELRDAAFVIHQSGVARAQEEQVRNVHAWCVGTVVAEADSQVELDPTVLEDFVQVTYHFNVARFITVNDDVESRVDVTNRKFKRALFVGRDFYVSKEEL